MASFLQYVLLYSALMLVVAVPIFLVARRQRRPTTIRNFAIGAGCVGAILAIIRAASEHSVQQCLDAGNTGCVDLGSSGMAVLFGGSYALIAWGRTWVLTR